MNLRELPGNRRLADITGRGVLLICTGIAVLSLAWLILLLLYNGARHLDWQFLSSYPSWRPSEAGVLPAIVGTIWIGFGSLFVALPIGIAAAIYLNEFARPNAVTTILRSGIANLAGVPSVVFGILGLAIFVRALALGKSLASASLTLALLTLPLIIVVAEEALRTVPRSVREAAFALGARRWQVVRHHVLPYSAPGMLTGSILALSRSMGETAPLILIGAVLYLSFLPTGPGSDFTALPIQSYFWAQQPQSEYHDLAWGAILLLLILTFLSNLTAVLLRDRYQRRYRW